MPAGSGGSLGCCGWGAGDAAWCGSPVVPTPCAPVFPSVPISPFPFQSDLFFAFPSAWRYYRSSASAAFLIGDCPASPASAATRWAGPGAAAFGAAWAGGFCRPLPWKTGVVLWCSFGNSACLCAAERVGWAQGRTLPWLRVAWPRGCAGPGRGSSSHATSESASPYEEVQGDLPGAHLTTFQLLGALPLADVAMQFLSHIDQYGELALDQDLAVGALHQHRRALPLDLAFALHRCWALQLRLSGWGAQLWVREVPQRTLATSQGLLHSNHKIIIRAASYIPLHPPMGADWSSI